MSIKKFNPPSLFSNKMWTPELDKQIQELLAPTVSIDVGDRLVIETVKTKYLVDVISIDEDFNIITVVDGNGDNYFWDETPDTRLLESTAQKKGKPTTLETIVNISKIVGENNGKI